MNAAILSLATACVLTASAPGCGVKPTRHGVHGLWTSPNPRDKAPDGALLEANNIVLRRTGMAEPRPGFAAGEEFSESYSITALIPYDGAMMHVSGFGEASDVANWPPSTNITDDDAADLQFDVDRGNVHAAEARKNLYLSTTDAMRKLTSSTDDVASRAGVLSPNAFGNSWIAGSTLADGYSVAYRVVLRRTDANGLIVRSAPSARAVVINDRGFSVYPAIGMYFDFAGAVGDTLEVYRSRAVPAAVTPPDELYLAFEREITAADLSAGYTDDPDFVPEADLGQALYTNGGREGIERANTMPPAAKDLALFRGSLFAANITYPHALRFLFTEGGDLSGSDGGIGYRYGTGTRTQGSDVITAFSDTTGLKVGMVSFEDDGWSGTENIRITAINGGSITVSETWDDPTDSTTITFSDSVRIKNVNEDLYFPARFAVMLAISVGGQPVSAAMRPTASGSAYYTARLLGTGSVWEGLSPVIGNRRSLVVSGADPDSLAFEIFATHGAEYEPELPEPTQANGEDSAQDAYPNGIAWSKKDQPEHFMLGGSRLLGADKTDLLRAIPTRTALWLLMGKGGGIHRLTGASERTGWRVDEADASTYLLHPNLAVAYGDAVYAWTSDGPVKISDAGVTPIGPQIENLTRTLETLLDHEQDNYAFAVANLKDGEVIFGLPDIDNLDASEPVAQVLVYNIERGVWSQWFEDASAYCAGAYDPSTRLLHFGRDDSGESRVERAPGSAVTHADRDVAVTIASLDGNEVTFTGAYPYGEGSMILQSGSWARVTNVISSSPTGVVDVDDASSLTAAACTGYEAYTTRITWVPKTGGASSTIKRYQSASIEWDETFGSSAWSVEFSGQPSAAAPLTRSATRAYARAASRDETRHLTDRSVAKNAQLYVTVEAEQADSRYRIGGMTVWSDVISARVSK